MKNWQQYIDLAAGAIAFLLAYFVFNKGGNPIGSAVLGVIVFIVVNKFYPPSRGGWPR